MALALAEIRNRDYAEVERGPKGPKNDEWPCVVCGRGVDTKTTKGIVWVRLHDGGSTIVTEAEAKERGEAGDLGWHPIGVACFRRRRALLAGYVT